MDVLVWREYKSKGMNIDDIKNEQVAVRWRKTIISTRPNKDDHRDDDNTNKHLYDTTL